MRTIISRCESLMERHGINQKELASLIGKSYRTVNSWFNSRKMTPKAIEVVKIAKALHTTAEYLVTGKEPETSFLNDKQQKILDATKSMTEDKLDNLVAVAESLALASASFSGDAKRGAG